MPTFGFWVLFHVNTFIKHIVPFHSQIIILATVFVHTALIPIIVIYSMYKLKLVKSVELEDKKERTIPYIITIIFYLSCYFMFRKNELPTLLHVFILAATVVLTLTFIINFFWKISAHMMAIGALAASIYVMGVRFDVDVNFYFIISVFVAGLLGFSRLKLDAHTSPQIYIGFFVGFIAQFAVMMYSL